MIVALSVQLPNGVSSSKDLWRMKACATNVITQVPATRWRLPETLGLAAGDVLRRAGHGGFVCGAELLDNSLFCISSAEASAMDPQQRLLLERGY